MKKYVSIILLFICGLLSASEVATGIVFHDINGNQIYDQEEAGVEGVMVSNGTEIVKTDTQGRYRIALNDPAILFIIKPKNWQVPLDSANKPLFYYIHKTAGSPTLRYLGSDPTGQLPQSINFPLIKNPEPNNFEIFIFGDPQPANTKHIEYLAADIISEVVQDSIRKFGISLGDIVSDNLSDYDELNQAFSQIGLPWYNVLGNHDLNFDVSKDELSDETFERIFGPATYAFQYGTAHFIILDDVIYTGKTESGNKTYIGGIRDDQFLFVENYLQNIPKHELVVLCMHIPVFNRISPKYKGDDTFRESDRLKLFNLLAEHKNTVSLSAHTHFQKQYFFSENEGWQQDKPHHHFNMGTACGDWYKGLINYDGYPDATMRDGTPNGYAVMKIEENEYSFRYKVAGASADKQMSVSIGNSDLNDSINKFVYANYYMGTNYDTLECKFDFSDEWMLMQKVYEPDPRTVKHYQLLKKHDNNFLGEQISSPHDCSHLWKLKIPSSLSKGYHTVIVRNRNTGKVSVNEKLVFKNN